MRLLRLGREVNTRYNIIRSVRLSWGWERCLLEGKPLPQNPGLAVDETYHTSYREIDDDIFIVETHEGQQKCTQ